MKSIPIFFTTMTLFSDQQLPFWTPLGFKNEFRNRQKIFISDEPFILYKNKDSTWKLIYDKCPHQGASLFRGKFYNRSEIICPYHGLRFQDGCIVPEQKSVFGKVCVPVLPVMEDSLFLYTLPLDSMIVNHHSTPFMPPEESNPEFRKLCGKVKIKRNSEAVIENVLDMLHVSYVHTFGNQNTPYPENIVYTKISNSSGRTTYQYPSGENSISRKVANQFYVTVENEYHLPSTTITRVFAGNYTKTVMTKSVAINEHETQLYWVMYRNFWNEEPLWALVMDAFLRLIMRRTLQEDRQILESTYEVKSRLRSKFDITINKFRASKKIFVKDKQK